MNVCMLIFAGYAANICGYVALVLSKQNSLYPTTVFIQNITNENLNSLQTMHTIYR